MLRVLVADDDGLVRMLIVDALTEAGFKVVEADHGDEALRIFCRQAESFDALFTDINMPGSVRGGRPKLNSPISGFPT